MALFQQSVITKHLASQNKILLSEKWKLFTLHFHNPGIQDNIRNSKEEEYQEGFLNDLFVSVLGYSKKPSPNFNLVTEKKNEKDNKKADGAILVADKVVGVIELKGTNTTDLNKIEIQAFSYKNNQKDCIYVVTSNFEKLRFYIDNAIEYIEFNLFLLTEKDFALLYLCLAYDNIANNIAKKIKEESLSQEDKITKQLYKDYSLFKNSLFHNLVSLNPDYEPLELFKKSQKLLDRFLFLFFAEDRQLLPPNSVRLILNDWRDLQERDENIPLYNRFRKYFEYLNIGYKGKRYDVFAYNGGLFKPDVTLDSIKIDDELLYEHTLKLSDYDFASEVDVNILGHIFENSLNELDEMKAKLEGTEIDKSATKRKKDGVFYTPKYITKYIVENTVGQLCTKKKEELEIDEADYITDKKRNIKTKKPLSDKLKVYKDWLLQLTIVDPACGSGAFLNEALNFLIGEHKYIDELLAKLLGETLVLSDVEKSILENNLFGVDINEESVEIAKLSLWLRTARPNRKLNDLNNNIKCGDSLIEEPAIAGNKAFDWQKEFPQIFEKGGFDVVIGNPPYVGQKGNKEVFNKIKDSNLFKDIYERKQDLYYYFLILSIHISQQHSRIGLIVPQYWLNAFGASKIRNYLTKNSDLILVADVSKVNVFPDAGVNSMIFIFDKKKGSNIIEIAKYEKNAFSKDYESIISNSQLNSESWNLFKNSDYVLFDTTNILSLGDICVLSPGIQTGCDKVSKSNISKITNSLNVSINDGIYVLTNDEVANLNLTKEEEKFIRPFFKNSDIERYFANNENNLQIIVTNNIDNIDLYPNLKKHLFKFKEITDNRFVNFALKNAYESGKWWYLYGYRPNTNFEGEKIIFPYRSTTANFSYSFKPYYGSIDIFYLTNLDTKFDYKYILAILNSKFIFYFIKKNFKIKGNVFEFYTQPMSELPIKKIHIDDQQPFIKKTDIMMGLSSDLHHHSEKLQRSIQREFHLDELPKKLQDWYGLSFAEFLKELEKKKVKITLAQKAEWENYFDTEASKVLEIKKQIDDTDKEIDAMVYKLYELSEEEITIIENSQ